MIGPWGGALWGWLVPMRQQLQWFEFQLRTKSAILRIAAPPGRADARPCAAALTLPSLALLPGGSAILKTYQHAAKTLSRF